MKALGVVLVLLGLHSAAFAGDKARADRLFEEGRGYLERKEYALACTAFEQSQQADPAIGTQLNIALCYEQWGKLASSYRAYLEAERLATAKKDNRAKHARKKVNELGPKLARLRITIPANADPYSIYLFDGKETERALLGDELLLDAGEHTIEVRVAGAPPKTTAIRLEPGEQQSITLELPVVAKTPTTTVAAAPPRNQRKLYAGIGLAGGGGLVIGIASYVALIARSDYNDAIAMCPGNLCQTRSAYDATQAARSRASWMTVVGGAGVAMVGVGVYLVLTSKGAPAKVEKVSARPLVAPDTIGVAIGGSL